MELLPAAKPNGSLMSTFAFAMTTSYALQSRTMPLDAVIRKFTVTFECAQFVRVQSVSSTDRPLIRAKVTPLTPLMRTSSAIVTDPQPSFGDTRIFFEAVPRPTFCRGAFDPDEEPNPGSVPGAIRMCTPATICVSVTAAMALPMAVQSQATSTTVAKVDPSLGVFSGQWVPFGP